MCTEKCPSASLWYEMYWLKKWSYQNVRCILLIQSENEAQKKIYNIISKIKGFLKVVIIIKRLKLAAYLKNKLGSNVVLFLQETNSVS